MEMYFVALYIYILAVKRKHNTAIVMNKRKVLNTKVKVKVIQQLGGGGDPHVRNWVL